MKLVIVTTLALLAGCRLKFEERTTVDAADDAPEDAPGTPAAIAFVQATGVWQVLNTAAATKAFANPLGAHHAAIAMVQFDNFGVTLTSITDTLGNAYSIVLGPVDLDIIRVYVAIAPDVLPGNTAVSAFFSAPLNAGMELFISEYSGVALVDPYDASSAATGANFAPDSMASGPVTTHGPRELLYGYGAGPCVAAGTGFAMRTNIHGDITEDLIVDVGQHQMTATSTCSTGGDRWVMYAAAFKPQLL